MDISLDLYLQLDVTSFGGQILVGYAIESSDALIVEFVPLISQTLTIHY